MPNEINAATMDASKIATDATEAVAGLTLVARLVDVFRRKRKHSHECNHDAILEAVQSIKTELHGMNKEFRLFQTEMLRWREEVQDRLVTQERRY